MAKRKNVTPAVARALRPHVTRPTELAAVVISTAVKHGVPPRTGGRKMGAKGGARAVLSERTRKVQLVAPRNAALRWGRLFTETAAAALMVTTLPVSSVYLGLAGLVIIGQLKALVTSELSERHGAVIYVMWRRHGNEISQRLEMLLPEVNAELRALDKRTMGKRELREILNELVELGCATPTLLGWRLKDKVWLTA